MRFINKIRFLDKRGIAVVWLAMGLFVLLIMFAGLAVDIWYMVNVKGSLGVAADSGALAGAALLGDTNDLTQSNARAEAITFAGKNIAAGAPVVIVTDNSNVLSTSNDITVGNWDATTRVYTPNITPVNAIQVRPQRTSDLPNNNPRGPVSIFFGKVFGWPTMSAKASAIASGGQILDTPAVSLCIKSCSIAGLPALLDIQSNLPCGATNGMSWTLFNSDSNIATNDTSCFVDGHSCDTSKCSKCTLSPQDIVNLCGTCVTTKNGTSDTLNELGTKFRDPAFDAANKDIVSGVVTAWRIGVPIMDRDCGDKPKCDQSSAQGCPPSQQGGVEPYHIQQWAKVTITQVCDNSDSTGLCSGKKGVVISTLTCVDCGSNPVSLLTGGVRLVK